MIKNLLLCLSLLFISIETKAETSKYIQITYNGKVYTYPYGESIHIGTNYAYNYITCIAGQPFLINNGGSSPAIQNLQGTCIIKGSN